MGIQARFICLEVHLPFFEPDPSIGHAFPGQSSFEGGIPSFRFLWMWPLADSLPSAGNQNIRGKSLKRIRQTISLRTTGAEPRSGPRYKIWLLACFLGHHKWLLLLSWGLPVSHQQDLYGYLAFKLVFQQSECPLSHRNQFSQLDFPKRISYPQTLYIAGVYKQVLRRWVEKLLKNS